MAEQSQFTKDPAAVLDYGISWAAALVGDPITTSTWTVQTGITAGVDSHDTTTTTIWLSGGTDGENYKVVNHIVTAGGRTDERTLTIQVRDR